ncbi:RNA polymerase sigma factor (sigma-70 family) [Prosthecobacter fusiformis]|uniref:RNA polymerase sigma factor (Sigma-70 family) n=1 Tax=Prosthecobacter fusiformis TaxID=48464 RepID=A0A4R7RR70_9BACT|nr:sigma-70 family RNA polymerase sigma factor [Prosthecobacter fusiformis]TDU67295.1 RNA polymerase sigma factor (sigma-70 family) [Prosthecobacter fusiformis]
MQALRSTDPGISRRSWAQAYPLLWEAAQRLARRLLAGDSHEHDREDLCATAMQQFVTGLVQSSSESFNQISTWDDCLSMMRHILRLRVLDFFRAQGRNREDAMEAVPDIPTPPRTDAASLSELLALVDELDPPKPDLLRDRFVDGYSTDEIAQRRQMNRNTVVSHFAQGLRYLRSRLEKLEQPGGLQP